MKNYVIDIKTIKIGFYYFCGTEIDQKFLQVEINKNYKIFLAT